jgi:hypothetical protein
VNEQRAGVVDPVPLFERVFLRRIIDINTRQVALGFAKQIEPETSVKALGFKRCQRGGRHLLLLLND